MDNERLPIKFFAPREIDELRVEGNRNQEPPRWLLTGQDLIDRSTQLLYPKKRYFESCWTPRFPKFVS